METCPECGSIFIQAENYGRGKIIRCLVKKCGWSTTSDWIKINKDKIKNPYLRVTI